MAKHVKRAKSSTRKKCRKGTISVRSEKKPAVRAPIIEFVIPPVLVTRKDVLRGCSIVERGRELDRRIATEVLGWKPHDTATTPFGTNLLTHNPPLSV